MTSPTHAALKSMREWMALFIHATKLDPATTSITFRGPGRHMPLNVKLQEVLDIADKAIFAEEYPDVRLVDYTNHREPGEFGEGATVKRHPIAWAWELGVRREATGQIYRWEKCVGFQLPEGSGATIRNMRPLYERADYLEDQP